MFQLTTEEWPAMRFYKYLNFNQIDEYVDIAKGVTA